MSDAKRLQKTIRQLMESQPDDSRLRDHLEGLTRDLAFPDLTWFWGPLLYKRNRAMFRSMILNHFSEWQVGTLRWKHIAWADHAEELEAWLADARSNRDSTLVRRLLSWKFSTKKGWGRDSKAWNAALLNDYREAATPAARAIVLDEYDDLFTLDEDTALSLYQCDRRCSSFLLKHLPNSFWTGEDRRKHWERLAQAAAKAGDEALQWELYRRQIPIKQWSADVSELARTVADPKQLCDELERRHPSGYGLRLGSGLIDLLNQRGRDVMPYVHSKLKDVLTGWFGDKPEPFVELAEKNGWWDLWAAAIRGSHNAKLFNRALDKLLDDESLLKPERLSRLRALAGVSREWNWPGFGIAKLHNLEDDVAVKLYQRYPDLARGPFKPSVLPTWWSTNFKLLDAAIAAQDESLVDAMASRIVTRYQFSHAADKTTKKLLQTAEMLADYYVAIREKDPVEFARRAANVLTQIPAYANYEFGKMLETNKLSRLLYVRSFDAYLAVPEAVRDLVEGSDIQVQKLAYRILAQDDDRARQLAVQSLDILLGTLLRPLHRKTRLEAFDALLNAARADADAARVILGRARKAFRLPDRGYPKERLVGLIGGILHAQPSLRSSKERPVVYGLSEAAT